MFSHPFHSFIHTDGEKDAIVIYYFLFPSMFGILHKFPIIDRLTHGGANEFTVANLHQTFAVIFTFRN